MDREIKESSVMGVVYIAAIVFVVALNLGILAGAVWLVLLRAMGVI